MRGGGCALAPPVLPCVVGFRGAGRTNLPCPLARSGSSTLKPWARSLPASARSRDSSILRPDQEASVREIHHRPEATALAPTAPTLPSAANHIIASAALRSRIDGTIAAALEKEFGTLFASKFRPSDICAQAQYLLYAHQGRGFEKLLSSAALHSLRAAVSECMRRLPPMVFFVDAIDETFETAPYHWMLCQQGLFDAVRRVLDDNALGGRLLVTIPTHHVMPPLRSIARRSPVLILLAFRPLLSDRCGHAVITAQGENIIDGRTNGNGCSSRSPQDQGQQKGTLLAHVARTLRPPRPRQVRRPARKRRRPGAPETTSGKVAKSRRSLRC